MSLTPPVFCNRCSGTNTDIYATVGTKIIYICHDCTAELGKPWLFRILPVALKTTDDRQSEVENQ